MRLYSQKQKRNGAAIYVMVLATALIVSLLGITALDHLRVNRSKSSLIYDRLEASQLAYSAVGVGTHFIEQDSSWRSNYTSGSESSPISLDTTRNISWILKDSDGDLSDSDTQLSLLGIGRCNSAIQVARVGLVAEEQTTGPALLRSQEDDSNKSDDDVKNNQWWGQYLIPTLPAEATAWKVTSVEFYMERDKNNRDFRARVYLADNNKLPSSTIYDSVDLDSKDYDKPWSWQTISFSGDYWINPGQAICVTIEGIDNDPMRVRYRNGGVSEQHSALLQGDGSTWTATEDKALLYRVNGIYKNGTYTLDIVEGTWRRGDAP